MGSLGTGELLIILAIVLLVFGGAKLPKLARSLGQAQREFKKGVVEEDASTDPPEETSTESSEETSTGDSA
jgi:sec-independent protein translocase protein TatA